MHRRCRILRTHVVIDELPHGIDLILPQLLRVPIFGQFIELHPNLGLHGGPGLRVQLPTRKQELIPKLLEEFFGHGLDGNLLSLGEPRRRPRQQIEHG
jgi:hypothetical protein